MTFLGHFPPSPFHFFSLNSHLPISAPLPKHEPTPPFTIPPPHHHHCTSAPPPITTVAVPITPISPPFPHFPFSHTKPNFSQKFMFCPLSLSFTCTNRENRLCVSFLCWFLLLQGVRLGFKEVLQTLVLGVPTKCLIKGPNQFPACLEGELHLLSPLGPMHSCQVPY